MQRGRWITYPLGDIYLQTIKPLRCLRRYPDALAVRTKNKQAKRTRRAKRGTLRPFLVCFRECDRRFIERLTQRENQSRFFLLNLLGEIFCFLRGATPLSKLLEYFNKARNFKDTPFLILFFFSVVDNFF
jgi:hypothetical protein